MRSFHIITVFARNYNILICSSFHATISAKKIFIVTVNYKYVQQAVSKDRHTEHCASRNDLLEVRTASISKLRKA